MDRTTEATNEFGEHRNREMLLAIRRRWATASDAQIDGSVSMRLPAIDDQPSASPGQGPGMRGSNSLRDLPDMTTMEIEYGNQERDDRSNHIAASTLPRYDRIRSRNAHRLYPGICGCEKRESNASFKCQWNPTEQNFESCSRQWIPARNGNHPNACQNYKKYSITKYFILDKYLEFEYLISHNNPTPNKKARLQPGFAGKLNLNLMFCLPPRLFAVNQKTGE
ncbi:hypothetical protein LEP1GSC168_0022 [Leptospira santarosai str. HAI134]|nr:hypothetical protein [Leptospira santarosai]EMO20750.1 hypothetical protein LEP1GSC168_0022 [Leptospira santarosai str. HAI134]